MEDIEFRVQQAFSAGLDQGRHEKAAIGKALAGAQADMANPKFDKVNPHFKNRFSSLASVRDAVVPVLAKHEIACLQDLTNVEGGVACTTTLIHSSGQTLTFGPLKMPVSKQDAQGFGSAATYARRYHLMAVANVVGDEDDDANEATGKPANATDAKPGWAHSPKEDVSHVPLDLIEDYVRRMALIASLDIPEEELNEKIYDLHHELNTKNREISGIYQASVDAMVAKKHVTSSHAWKKAVNAHIAKQRAA
jgi:hypothetical protein